MENFSGKTDEELASLCAGGSKAFYGNRCDGVALDPRSYGGIVDYEPTELGVPARCGTPLADIEAAVAAHRQLLPFEPPRFADGGARATLGGMVAAGLAGPRRVAAGRLPGTGDAKVSPARWTAAYDEARRWAGFAG